MYDMSEHVRIARSCTEASLGYAEATANAYSEVMSSALGAMAEFARELNADQERAAKRRRSWFRTPEELESERSNAGAGDVRTALFSDEHRGHARTALRRPARRAASEPVWPGPFGGSFDPMKAWLDMMPLMTAAPAAWPGAFAMLACGVPRSVAWPMASANVAALDAVNRTAEVVNQTFPAYHGESGYASATLAAPHAAVALFLAAPIAANAFWPWVAAA